MVVAFGQTPVMGAAAAHCPLGGIPEIWAVGWLAPDEAGDCRLLPRVAIAAGLKSGR